MKAGEQSPGSKPLTLGDLRAMRESGEPIACLTAYDSTFAVAQEAAGVDLILIGDTLGMVVQGHDSTVPVRVDDIIYHTQCVTRAVRRPWVVADMPFLSVRSPQVAVEAGEPWRRAPAVVSAGNGGHWPR